LILKDYGDEDDGNEEEKEKCSNKESSEAYKHDRKKKTMKIK